MRREEALEIYKQEQSRHNNLREIQWKMNVAFWTFIALGISNIETLSYYLSILSIIILSIAFLVAHFLFIFNVQRSLEASKRIEREIVQKLNVNADKDSCIEISINKRPSWSDRDMWQNGWTWFAFQLLATLVLISVFVLTARFAILNSC